MTGPDGSLDTARRLLAQAQRLGGIGSWEWDLATDEIEASDEMLRIFGLDPSMDPGRDDAWFELIHPEDRELLKAAEHASLAGAPHDVIYRIVRPDGSIRVLHEIGEVITDAAGVPVRMLGTFRDITAESER